MFPRRTNGQIGPAWNAIVCVDWGKDRAKRRAWIADVEQRTVVPLEVPTTVREILAYAAERPGRTLVGIDAALGVPASYFESARTEVGAWREASDFPAWLVAAMAHPGFRDEARSAADWRLDRPFIAVPAGVGSLGAFWERAGGRLLRQIDVATGAKCVFVVSGIPGTVGSGTRELWKELVPLLTGERSFGIWPFDGSLDAMPDRRVVLAEIYPRVCYALALAPSLPAPLESIAKVVAAARDTATTRLKHAGWLRSHGVRVDAMERARGDEDDFDAMMSAAGLLRCVLDGSALDGPSANAVEGGILGLESLSLRPPRSPSTPRPRVSKVAPQDPGVSRVEPPALPVARVKASECAPTGAPQFHCPIPDCGKVFLGSRGGWDAHVASLRMHPGWHPAVGDPKQRKAIFEAEFASWFC